MTLLLSRLIRFNTVLERLAIAVGALLVALMVLIVFGGAHISVDFLPDKLGSGGRRALKAVISLIAIAAGATFVVAGWDATSLFRMIGQVTEMEWEFPIWYIYLSFPVGFTILISFAVENLLRAVTGYDEPGGAALAGVHAVTE